jgi:signal transduction histidine kinase/GAF domain-containing protein/ActR/RegA family two-component response regulator
VTARAPSPEHDGSAARGIELEPGAEPSLAALLDGVIRLLEHDTEAVCSIFLYDRAAGRLRLGCAPHLPPALVTALDGCALGPDSGICGVAIQRGERVIAGDIHAEPACLELLARGPAPALFGCLAEPIRDSDGAIVGAAAMYFRERRGPTEVECARIEAAAHLAAVALRAERTRARAMHLARLYAVSSGVGGALLRTHDAPQLYDVACRIAVERGLASFAWVGLYRSEADVFEPVSRSGNDAGYLELARLSLRDPGVKLGPAARALLTGEPAVSNDIARDPTFHWKDAAFERGHRAVAAFPLFDAARPHGVLVLYGATVDFFGDEEVRVLTALAADLSFTIEFAKNEAERVRLLGALDERSAQLARLERLYASLSEVNHAIVRATSPIELMERVTGALVDAGGVAMAWVGRPGASTPRVEPIARAGDGDGYVDEVVIHAEEGPLGSGPAGVALREGRVALANDFLNDPSTAPWHEAAERRGWRAAAALPLRCADAGWGVLVTYAREQAFFGAAEVALLEQVARDVSFALDVLANEAKRRDAERALRDSEDRLRVLQRLTDAIQTEPDADHTLAHAVRVLGEHLGASRCSYAHIELAHDSLEIPHDYTAGCRSLVGRHPISQMMSAQTVERLTNGEPLVLRDATAVEEPEVRARFVRLQIGAIVMCGLVRRGELRALMAVHAPTPREWSAHEIGLVQEFVERCWDQIERRAAEAKLREREALLRIAGAAAKLGGWSVDLPTLRATCSDEVCTILELPPGTVPTVDQAVAWCLPQDRELLRTRGLACAMAGTPLDIEVQFVTAKQRTVWVRLMGRAERNAAGMILRLHGALQDISDRKLLEDQLRQAQKMEAVGQLAGGVAHDFNNLLSVILTCSAILAEELGPNDPARGDVLEIQKAGERAAALTRQLLTFSRHQILRPRVIHLAQVVSGMEKMLRHLLGAGVELSLLTPSSSGQVRADPGQIEQVIMNLVVNARDAMPSGGQIVVDLANEEVGEATRANRPAIPEGRYVRLTVTDTGTGMDAATRERIFEPFFTTKGQGKGTGLGLSTTFGIVAQSGGYIRVQSELGVGTTFEIHLPRVDAPPERAARESQAPALSGSETILVVEDDEQVRAVVCTTLRRAGYRVLEAQNGGEAFLISEQRQESIDLLLTDVVMPRMKGPELAARLSPARPAMRVLYMSGYNEDAVLQDGVRQGGIEFINKPFTPNILLARIRAVLSTDALSGAGLGGRKFSPPSGRP